MLNLIKIKTNKEKFPKQYYAIVSGLLFGKVLSYEEIDILVGLQKLAKKGKFNTKDVDKLTILLSKGKEEIEETITSLRKKKVIRRNTVGSLPEFNATHKLMFYFYE